MVESSIIRSGKTLFRGDWSGKSFYGHSPSTVYLYRTVVSNWLKELHLVVVKRLGLSLSRISVIRLTDLIGMTIVVERDVKQQNKLTNKTWELSNFI